MIAYYLTLLVVVLVTVGARHWYRSALAKQAARDAAALASCRFGAKHRTAALAAPHDQSKTEVSQRKADRAASRQRAKAAKVIQQIAAQPSKVTPMRRRVK